MSTLTKAELVSLVAKEADTVTKADIERIIKALTAVITKQVSEGNEISIPELGKFVKAHRAARKGHNPQTGKAIKIAAKDVPTFKAAKAFKDAVA